MRVGGRCVCVCVRVCLRACVCVYGYLVLPISEI